MTNEISIREAWELAMNIIPEKYRAGAATLEEVDFSMERTMIMQAYGSISSAKSDYKNSLRKIESQFAKNTEQRYIESSLLNLRCAGAYLILNGIDPLHPDTKKTVNTHGRKMVGLRKAASETKHIGHGAHVQIGYDMDDGEIVTNYHYGNSWSQYHSSSVITVINAYVPLTMQEIANAIHARLDDIENGTW